MSHLLTNEQAAEIARSRSAEIASDIYVRNPLAMADEEFAERTRQAIEHDLVVTLEGLMEPDEAGEGS